MESVRPQAIQLVRIILKKDCCSIFSMLKSPPEFNSPKHLPCSPPPLSAASTSLTLKPNTSLLGKSTAIRCRIMPPENRWKSPLSNGGSRRICLTIRLKLKFSEDQSLLHPSMNHHKHVLFQWSYTPKFIVLYTFMCYRHVNERGVRSWRGRISI